MGKIESQAFIHSCVKILLHIFFFLDIRCSKRKYRLSLNRIKRRRTSVPTVSWDTPLIVPDIASDSAKQPHDETITDACSTPNINNSSKVINSNNSNVQLPTNDSRFNMQPLDSPSASSHTPSLPEYVSVSSEPPNHTNDAFLITPAATTSFDSASEHLGRPLKDNHTKSHIFIARKRLAFSRTYLTPGKRTTINTVTQAMGILKHKDLEAYNDLLSFFQLVINGKYPLTNISFQLCLDTVRWYSQTNVSQIRFRDSCVLFLVVLWMIFGGQIIRLLQGKRLSDRNDEPDEKMNPQDSSINFAVPSINSIRERALQDQMVPRELSPGIIKETIKLVSENESVKVKSFIIAMDGKKYPVD